MKKIDVTDLIEAGAHFGHLTRRWNPKMKPYIFMEKNGIHIIDLKKTKTLLADAAQKLSDVVAEGKKVMFVGTKKQAKDIIASEAKKCEQNWVSERWLGGMLTNFSTIRKSIKRLTNIEKMESDGTFEKITKKERLFLTREKDKLRKVLDGVETMNKLPGALFIVDIKKEAIAVAEAKRLNVPVFAIVDTNCDPDIVDYLIPANDDAVKTIEIITKVMSDAVTDGLARAKELRAQEAAEKERVRKEREEEEKLQPKEVKESKPHRRERGQQKEVENKPVENKQTESEQKDKSE
ncbi:MAG: 30S ribosomal protein S2 [Ignavibacteriales bacterium]|nr:MAG: 30S ribosomal protein S2 [Ignavibacteriales bacterium]